MILSTAEWTTALTPTVLATMIGLFREMWLLCPMRILNIEFGTAVLMRLPPAGLVPPWTVPASATDTLPILTLWFRLPRLKQRTCTLLELGLLTEPNPTTKAPFPLTRILTRLFTCTLRKKAGALSPAILLNPLQMVMQLRKTRGHTRQSTILLLSVACRTPLLSLVPKVMKLTGLCRSFGCLATVPPFPRTTLRNSLGNLFAGRFKLFPKKSTMDLGKLTALFPVQTLLLPNPPRITKRVTLLIIPEEGAIPMTLLNTPPMLVHTLPIPLYLLPKLIVPVRRRRPAHRLFGTRRPQILAEAARTLFLNLLQQLWTLL